MTKKSLKITKSAALLSLGKLAALDGDRGALFELEGSEIAVPLDLDELSELAKANLLTLDCAFDLTVTVAADLDAEEDSAI